MLFFKKGLHYHLHFLISFPSNRLSTKIQESNSGPLSSHLISSVGSWTFSEMMYKKPMFSIDSLIPTNIKFLVHLMKAQLNSIGRSYVIQGPSLPRVPSSSPLCSKAREQISPPNLFSYLSGVLIYSQCLKSNLRVDHFRKIACFIRRTINIILPIS